MAGRPSETPVEIETRRTQIVSRFADRAPRVELDEEGIIKVSAAQFIEAVNIFPEAFSILKDAALANGA